MSDGTGDGQEEHTVSLKALKLLMSKEERREFGILELQVELEKQRADYQRASADKADAELRMELARREVAKLERKLEETQGL